MSKIKEFFEHLENARFNEAYSLIAMNVNLIDKDFSDQSGNTVIHLLIINLLKNIKRIWSPYTRNSYSLDVLERPREETQTCVDNMHSLLDKLLDIGFEFEKPNNSGIKPAYLFKGECIGFCEPSLGKIQREIIDKFEKRSSRVYDGRKYVSGFDLHLENESTRSFVPIPNACTYLDSDGLDLSLHQRFEILENYFRHNGLSALNLVFINVGFVVSGFEGINGYQAFISIPLLDPKKIIIKNNGTFIHAEKALSDYLCNKTVIEDLVNKLYNALNGNIRKVDAVILDIYSTREVCRNCESILHGLQSDLKETGFLIQLEESLQSKGILAPIQENAGKHLPVVIRASGFDDASAYGDQSINYPIPSASMTYNTNITHFDENVLLHIAPKNHEFINSMIYTGKKQQIASIYENIEIYFIKEQDRVNVLLQTAFANSSASEVARNVDQMNSTVSYSELVSYKLRQIRSTSELKATAEAIQTCSSIGTKPITLVLQYMYNIRNKPSDIEDVITQALASEEILQEMTQKVNI